MLKNALFFCLTDYKVFDFLGISEYCEQDEGIIDKAIEEDVFFTLREVILKSAVFHREVYFHFKTSRAMLDKCQFILVCYLHKALKINFQI